MSTERDQQRATHPTDRWVRALVALTVVALAATVAVRYWPRTAGGDRPPTASTSAGTPAVSTKTPAAGVAPAVAPPATYPDVSPPLADFVNRRAAHRVTPDFAARVERVTTAADLAAVTAILKDTTDTDTVRNEAASLLARSGYAGLIADLLAILQKPAEGPRFRAFCVQHLWQNYAAADAKRQAELDGVFRERLGDPDREVRREALLALVRLGKPEGQQTAEKWLTDPATSDVRDLAIHCLALLDRRDRVPDIRKHLADPDDIVRIAAIVVLSQWGDTESRPAFAAAAQSGSVRLQRAGKAALARLDQPTPARAVPAPVPPEP